MMEVKESTFTFTTKATSTEDIIKEINDIKLIILAVSLKLDENSRTQLVKELSEVDSPAIKQWVLNLSSVKRG
ncbi:hypothetical protein [Yersinia intermedia]|uniref:hypothetical protein n=1 Tax=Yersinia intermedia TaxID=631 RepID=UPI0005DFAAE7|nr:hypothetical protein [Yersinia intermedia]CNE43805.1 Uncharacterised protein [Yersinia intermedia]